VPAAEAAAAAATRIAGPVAVKLSAPGLLHATEAGGVALGLRTPDDVAAAAARMLEGRPADARVLVATMADGVEVLVSARCDGVVPTLVVGLGGVWSEALADVVTLPLPAGPDDVLDALLRLRGAALLTGGRGTEPLAVEALAGLASRLGDLLLTTGDLLSVELNPVLVNVSAAVAVDALALWTGLAAPA
jgi:hypothetical protein